ncbi:MAG TPA: AAA family ATPase [Tepidisphaeraceae bacterium]|nr:AAA family ATPase [Tepidisphaeraceae bacterium]
MEMIVFAGIPASGKTTFYRDRFLATHVRVSLDLLKTRERQDILLHACLAAKQPLVVDNTNTTAAARAPYEQLARAAKFRAVLYFFEVTTRVAVARNAARTGKAKVPSVAIFAGQKKLQTPTRAEGFDAVFRVAPADANAAPAPAASPAYLVEPWPEDRL